MNENIFYGKLEYNTENKTELSFMLKVKIVHNLWTNFEKENLPQVVANSDDYKNIFLIPWRHHKIIIDKCRNDQQKALFYVNKVIENNWSRAVLLNFLDTDLYERQGNDLWSKSKGRFHIFRSCLNFTCA